MTKAFAGFLLGCLAILSFAAQGAAQDPIYYPQRIEWHTINQLLPSDDQQGAAFSLPNADEAVLQLETRAFVEWDQGRFLSIGFDSADVAKASQLSVWVSRGDGLFRQMQPDRDQAGQWIFSRAKEARAVVMLENNSQQANGLTLRLAQSKQTTAPALSVRSEVILHSRQQIQTNHSDGFQRQAFNQLNAQQTLNYTFEGPGEYSFLWRTPWLAEYGLSQLMEVQWALDEQAPSTEVIKIQPRDDRLLETPDGDQVYSRLAQIRVFIPEGEHTVQLSADRDILAYWMRSNQREQFLYERNYAPQWAIEGVGGDPLQTERLAASQRKDYHLLTDSGGLHPDYREHLPSVYFYRQLEPLQADKLIAIKPSVLTAPEKGSPSVHWLPPGQANEIRSQYFSQLGRQSQTDYVIPPTSHQPPLRLYLRSMMHSDVRFSLLSDRGEQINLAYFPASGLADEMEAALPLTQVAELGVEPGAEPRAESGAEIVAMQIIEFKQPFHQVTVQNHSEYAITSHLSYKNRSEAKTDEQSFFDQVNPATAPIILAKLHQDQAVFDSLLLTGEVTQWKKRLNTRYHNFVQRYPVMSAAEGRRLHGDLNTVLANVNQLYGTDIASLDGLIDTLEANGAPRRANKLLAAFAMLPVGEWQTLAQRRFLTRLAEQERWFDIEGYWAYRFIVSKQPQALVELAQVLFRQNQFALASQWFWLAYQAQLLPQLPDEALLASFNSGYSGLPARWLALLETQPVELPASWHYWTAAASSEIDNATRVTIHNRGFDSYLSAFKLVAKQARTFTFAGPLRLKLTVYGQKSLGAVEWPAADWLSVGERRYLLSGMSDSLNLAVATDPNVQLAGPKTIVIDLPAGEHQLEVMLAHQDALLSWQQQSDLMDELVQSEQFKRGTDELVNHRLLATPSLESREGLLARFGELLLQPALSDQDISAANHWAQGVNLSPIARQWLAVINQDQGWQKWQSVISSGGHQSVSQHSWQPSAPNLRLQRALLTEQPAAGERLLSAVNTQVIEIDRKTQTTLTLQLRQIHRFGDLGVPAQVLLEVDGKRQIVTATTQTLSLSPGRHQISLSLVNEGIRAWVFFSVADIPPLKSQYDLATRTQPLVVFVPAGSWLRIDEVSTNNRLTSRNRYIEQAQSLTLLPSAGASSSLFRVFKWGKKVADKAVIEDFPIEKPEIAARHTYWLPTNQDNWLTYDKYARDEQHEGTWGLSAGYRSRQNFDEDEENEEEQFVEFGWHYRRNVPDWQSHFRSKVAVRKHDAASLETLVNENDWVYRPSRYWDFSARLNGYYQYQAKQSVINGGLALFSSVSAGWKQYWQDDIDNKLRLTIFARRLSLNPADVLDEEEDEEDDELFAVDDDVYSDYKDQHRRGLRLSDTWQHRLWLDARVRLQAGLTTNDDWDLFEPDRVFFSAGFWQYWRPLTVKLDLQHSRFKKDFDRGNSFGRTTAKLDFQWQQWSHMGHLWRIDSFFQYDISNNEPGFGLTLSWNQTHGQGFDDFAPSRLPFGSLKRRHSYHVIESNQVVSGHE